VGVDGLAFVVVDRPGLQVALVILRDFSMRHSWWYELMTKSAVTGVPSGQAARLVV
jgi:hypothetical protein